MRYTRKVIMIWSVFIIAFLTGYYFWHQKEIQIVTIEADLGPTKIRPEDPGGIIIPNKDSLIYNQDIFNKKRIQLTPLPEDPILIEKPVLVNTSDQVIYSDSIDDILNNIEHYEKYYADIAANLKQNNELIDETISSDAQSVSNSSEEVTDSSGLQIEKPVIQRRQAGNVKANNKDGYLLQLSVGFNESDAQNKWQIIKKKHHKLLGKKELVLQKGQGNNGKFYYLIMTGYYESFSDAKYVCRQLIAQKQSCIITK